jgi:hypothetical protein
VRDKEAMSLAVGSYRGLQRGKRENSPSKGMITVIKAAAGDENTLAQEALHHHLSTEEIREAAKHYLLRMLLDPERQGIRLLGLADDAKETEIKDHKRWLLKWLHPDRNPNSWEQALFHRVNAIKIEAVKIDGQKPAPTMVPTDRKHHSVQIEKRRKFQRHRLVPSETRKRDTSARRLLFQFAKPVLASAIIAATIIITYSMRDSLQAMSVELLNSLMSS